jgi:hypothetical protein
MIRAEGGQLAAMLGAVALLAFICGMPAGAVWWRHLTDGARFADQTEHDVRRFTEWTQREKGQGS